MEKLELIHLRKEESIKSSKGLYKYYIKENGSKKANKIAYDILMEYLLDGNFDLLNELIKLNDDIIKDGNYFFYYLISYQINNSHEKNLSKERYKLSPALENIKNYPTFSNYKAAKKVNFLDNLADKFKNEKIKLFFYNLALKHNRPLGAFVLGRYYESKDKLDEAYKYYEIAANYEHKEAMVKMLDKGIEDKKQRKLYIAKVIDDYHLKYIPEYVDMLLEEKNEKLAYLYLLRGIMSKNLEIIYKLAKCYEHGIHVKQNIFYTYLLYLASNNYKDSALKIKELKPTIIEEYSKRIDEVVQIDLDEEKEELKKQEEINKLKQIEIEKEKEELKKQEKYRKYLIEEFGKKVVLLENVNEPINNYKYKNDLSYKRIYDTNDLNYKKACKEENIAKRFKLIEEAAKNEHTYSMMALFDLYYGIDDSKALSYLYHASITNRDAKIKYNEVIKKVKEDLRNNQDKLKEMLKLANQNDKGSVEKIKIAFNNIKLTKKVIQVFEDEAINSNEYAFNFIYNYYLEELNDKESILNLLSQCALNNQMYAIKKICPRYTDSSYIISNPKVMDVILKLDIDDFDIIYSQAKILGTKDFKSDNFNYDPKQAFEKYKYLEEKHGLTNKRLCETIAYCYEYGLGVEKNIKTAIKYYKLCDSSRYKILKEDLSGKKQEYIVYDYVTDARHLERRYNNLQVSQFEKDNPKTYEMIKLRNQSKKKEVLEKELIIRNELLDLGYTLNEIYKQGEFVGNELKKQKLYKDRLEKKRLESIKPKETVQVQEVKTVQQVVKPKETVQIQEVKTIQQAVKQQEQPKPTNQAKPAANKSSNVIPMSDDDPLYKELAIYTKTRTGEIEAKRIASLRKVLNYPTKPQMMPEYDKYGIKHSKKEREKKYLQELEERESKINEYYQRLYKLPNKIHADYNGYRKKVWRLSSSSQILTVKNFIKQCEDEYNSRFRSFEEENKISITASNYKFVNSEGGSISNATGVERMIVSVPTYAKEITITIRGIITYEKNYSDPIADEMMAFQSSELSKVMSWNEYAKQKDVATMIHNNTYLNSSQRINQNRQARTEMERQAEIKKFINDKFDKVDIFAGRYVDGFGTKQYFEGLVKKIKYEFIWKVKE